MRGNKFKINLGPTRPLLYFLTSFFSATTGFFSGTAGFFVTCFILKRSINDGELAASLADFLATGGRMSPAPVVEVLDKLDTDELAMLDRRGGGTGTPGPSDNRPRDGSMLRRWARTVTPIGVTVIGLNPKLLRRLICAFLADFWCSVMVVAVRLR